MSFHLFLLLWSSLQRWLPLILGDFCTTHCFFCSEPEKAIFLCVSVYPMYEALSPRALMWGLINTFLWISSLLLRHLGYQGSSLSTQNVQCVYLHVWACALMCTCKFWGSIEEEGRCFCCQVTFLCIHSMCIFVEWGAAEGWDRVGKSNIADGRTCSHRCGVPKEETPMEMIHLTAGSSSSFGGRPVIFCSFLYFAQTYQVFIRSHLSFFVSPMGNLIPEVSKVISNHFLFSKHHGSQDTILIRL